VIRCYVSGRGMQATHRTRDFKVEVIHLLESTGLGYDTRFRYYRRQFPEMEPGALAELVCEPIENYDKDWPDYRAVHAEGRNQDEVITTFVMERDMWFRREAQAAIYCYDEAGFGSGVNSMRFIQAGKPILGFYDPVVEGRRVNLHNVLQLQAEFPALVTLVRYRTVQEIGPRLIPWLQALGADTQ
jgi:hypothetical protein